MGFISAALRGAAVATAWLLGACAANVPAQDARLQPLHAGAGRSELRVQQPVTVKLSTGYSREISPQVAWQPVGELPQGVVYRPLNSAFSIEGRHAHEAYLVVDAGNLVGFYLPGESRFSPLSPPLPLPLGAKR